MLGFFRCEDKGVRGQLVTPEISEYNKLTFFAKKFRLSALDLEEFDMVWINNMLEVANAENEVEIAKAEITKNGGK